MIGLPPLRNQFDTAPAPGITGVPETHRRDFYLATDGSYRATEHRAGIGCVLETFDGHRIERTADSVVAPNNMVAEYRGLLAGFEVLFSYISPGDRVGILVDNVELGWSLNQLVNFTHHPSIHDIHDELVPSGLRGHWRNLGERIVELDDIRTVVIESSDNPAHVLANDPKRYGHLTSKNNFVPIDRSGYSAHRSYADD